MTLITRAKRVLSKAALAVAVAACAAGVICLPGGAEAQFAPGGGSGSHYSRPGGGSGYSRPDGGSKYTRPPLSGQERRDYFERRFPSSPRNRSAGDLSQSRAASGRALKDYRSEQEYNAQFRKQPQSAPDRSEGSGVPRVPRESYDQWSNRRSTYYGDRGWRTPDYAWQSRPSFGAWDALWLWFLLDTLNKPGHAAFFHNHTTDPGYLEWRKEADKLAQDNPELKAKLAALDADLKARQIQPRDPAYLPPDANPKVALSAQKAVEPGSSFPWGTILLVSLLVGGGVALYVYAQQRRGQPVGILGTYARNTLNRAPEQQRLFRVGMVVTIDEAPFILAGDRIAVKKPAEAGESRAGAEAIGQLGAGANALYRVYVTGGFFQIHLDRGGQPDECRWFSQFDEFTPAGRGGPEDGDSWAFWLDEEQGQVGWPEFQTPDGQLYERAWAPGRERTPPVRFEEALTDLQGSRVVRHDMMLYQRPTGLDAPAPETEYALLDVVEDGEEASLRIHVGVDINPASLSLA